MIPSTKLRKSPRVRALPTAFALTLIAAGCTWRAVPGGDATAPTGSARARVTLTGSGTSTVARVVLTVSPGIGSFFRPVEVDLDGSSGDWTGYVSTIPAGPGRHFDVVALDAGGGPILRGSAVKDIAAGAVASVSIQLVGSSPPFENAVPVIEEVSISGKVVRPGATVDVRVSAHDPDPTDSVSFLWTSTCGAFDAPAHPIVAWTAPALDGTTCNLSITVSDERGASATATLTVAVTSGLTRTISGTRLVTHWPDSPASTVTSPAPDVATAAAPWTLVRDPSGDPTVQTGGYIRGDGSFVEGHFASDGTFAIPGVVGPNYTLCFRLSSGTLGCTDTAEDQVDLGYDVLGRPDQARATESTPVTLALSGLDPWNPNVEQVQITSSGANLWDVAAAAGDFRGGDTSGNVLEDWHWANGTGAILNLLAPEDILFVHQLSTRSIYVDQSILYYASATRATPLPTDPLAISDIAVRDGQPSTIAVALEGLPLSNALLVNWDPPKFEEHLAAMGPAARTTAAAQAHTFEVEASAVALQCPAPGASGSPELLRFQLPAGAGAIAATLYYGQFLPASWREWRAARFSAQVSYRAPGALTPMEETVEVARRDPLPAGDDAIVPVVSPVRAVRINGRDAFQDYLGVTPTPTLSWSPPAIGSPTSYLVEVFKLHAYGRVTTSFAVLQYETQNTAITVPPSLLEAGYSYYARVTAQVTSVPYDASPFRVANVFAHAAALTGTFSP